VQPGTYDLLPDDLDPATCGACLWIWADVSTLAEPYERWFATGGRLVLTSAAGRLTGRLEGVSYRRVTLEEDVWVFHDDGCDTHIVELRFDELI
jgi:hypothetical protein